MDFRHKRKAPARKRPAPFARPALVAALAGALAACTGRDEARPARPRPEQPAAAHEAAAQQPGPFDTLRDAYAPYMPADDPLAFAMKVRAVAADRQGLWRGGKDLFFRWCRGRAEGPIGGWLADPESYVTQQGDQHLGNVGTYLAAGEFGTLGFGVVDFDDSCRLPFQFELLQGLISLRLAAEEADVHLGHDRLGRLADVLLREYAAAARAAAGGATAADLLAKDRVVATMLRPARKHSYEKELEQYTSADDRLVGVRATRRGEVKDVLRPLPEGRADELAVGIAEAALRTPESARLFRLKTPEQFRNAVADAALRTRVGSAGSQGLRKYFVLLDRPLEGVDHDLIVYLKQQVPSAAERAGLAPADARDPGRRCAEDVDELSRPRPYFNGWCRVGAESYWVTLREPWTSELDPRDVEDFDDLLWAAKVWAVAAGASHFGPGQSERIAARCDDRLRGDLLRLGDDFSKQLDADYRKLARDPRVRDLVRQADDALDRERPGGESKHSRRRRPEEQ